MPDIYETYFQSYLQLFPITATFLGQPKWDDRFTDIYSREHRMENMTLLHSTLEELEVFEMTGVTLEHRAFRYALEMTLEGYQYPLECLPLSQMNNIFLVMTEIIRDYQKIGTHRELKRFRRRMREFRTAADSQVGCLLEGMQRGIVLPRVIAEQVQTQLHTLLRDKPYLKREVPSRLRKAFRRILDKYFTPAIQYTIMFMDQYYLPMCRETLGYGSLPGGDAMYDYLARLHTTLEKIDVHEIHGMGISETARILEEKETLAKTLPIQDLMNHKEFIPSSREEILELYRAEQKEIAHEILPYYFGTLRPIQDYDIKAVPDYSEEFQTTAYYMPPSLDKSQKGTFYVNLRNLKEHPTYKTEVLSLHEGNPGHHFQIAISLDLGIPNYRAYGDWNAYFEGWGLYTETLGTYRDGYGRLGKYDYELMRSIRLIVDTGIHEMGWSVDKCRDLFRSCTDLVESEIDAEIYRYIAMPAQALSYKIGELHILRNRAEYFKIHGEGKTQYQQFHRNIIEAGPLPLWLLGHNEQDEIVT